VFPEKFRHAGSNAGARQWLNELRLAAAGMALPAGSCTECVTSKTTG